MADLLAVDQHGRRTLDLLIDHWSHEPISEVLAGEITVFDPACLAC
jgi:hypothetical protein